MVADVIPHILRFGNRPGGLDYELSDTPPAIPMPFPQGAQNSAKVVPTDPYFNTAMMSFRLILIQVALLSDCKDIIYTCQKRSKETPGT